MDRPRSIEVGRAEQVLPYPLRDERGERSQAQRDDAQRLVQGRECGRVAVPETPARAAHVPVGEVVDEGRQQPPGALGVERLECLVDARRQGLRLRQDPPVDDGPVGGCGIARAGCPARGAGVEGLEAHGVPVREQRLADDVADGRVPDPSGLPRGAAGQHEPPNRIGAVRVHQRDRLEDVAPVHRGFLVMWIDLGQCGLPAGFLHPQFKLGLVRIQPYGRCSIRTANTGSAHIEPVLAW